MKGLFQRGILGSCEPLLHFRVELIHRHAGEGGSEDLLEVLHRELRHRLAVAGHHRFERLDVLEFRLRFHDRRDPLQAVHHLRVHRVRDPQRAVLVEGGDALGGRHELRAALRGGRLHELDNRLLGRAVVPRRQRIGLGMGARAQ